MLKIEICSDSSENHDLEIGTYKLNSKISDSIYICEYVSNETVLFDGYVNIKDTSEIKKYLYKTHNHIIEHEYYTEELIPSKKYKYYWQKIVYFDDQKYKLFENIMKLEYSKRYIMDALGVNKCVLIYGEPGTGKTTLSKAIVQKLSIRLNKTYKLRIVKCSQLFSRFYGESMKIINNVFKTCSENTIIIVDEADSILMKRINVFTKNEPGDSLRIINTLLNIIDDARNLIIFTTNFKDELDEAFLSRCDIVFNMKVLDHKNTYNLVKTILEDIQTIDLLESHKILDFSSVEVCGKLCDDASFLLFEISNQIQGKSPRIIKKMIFELLRNQKEEMKSFLKRFKLFIDDRFYKELLIIDTPQSSTRLFE